MIRSSNSLYVALQHFKKRGMVQELLYCERGRRKLALVSIGEMLDLSGEEWRRISEGGWSNGEEHDEQPLREPVR